MSNADRIPVPKMAVPKVQRKVPIFARPSINLDGSKTQVRRVWRSVPATDLIEGDTVPGIGLISTVDEQISMPDLTAVLTMPPGAAHHSTWTVTVTGGQGNHRVFRGEELVWAFAASNEPL